MVKKQYEAGIAFEEINKQVSEALNNYVNDNNLRLVGQPVPQPVEELDHNAEQLSVAFEVGFEPDFKVDLSKYEAPHYKVEASDKEIGQSIDNMRKRFAEQVPQDAVGDDSHINLEISQVVEEGAAGEHHHEPKKITIDAAKKEVFYLVKALKMDESVKVSKADLEANEELAKELSFSKEEVEHLHHNEICLLYTSRCV